MSKGCDGFLFPLSSFACDYEYYYTLEEVKKFKEKYKDALCFIVMNKLYQNKELDSLTKILKEINKLNITGVLFYDLAVLQIVKEEKLEIPLYWNQTHMVTNSDTANFYFEHGVSGIYLANEITLDEIVAIKHKSKGKVMMMLTGYPVVAMSKRKLVTNYYKGQQKEIEKHEFEDGQVSVEVINARFLKPLERETIKSSILKTKNVITIEDGTVINGLATAIKELIVEEKLEEINLKTYAYPDKFIEHGSVEELEKRYKIDEETILKDFIGRKDGQTTNIKRI